MLAAPDIGPCPPLRPSDIVRALRHLPSAPKVLPRLKLVLRDGNSALEEVVSLVRLDPGLATRVMQIANSAYFFTGARCLSVDEAVRRVGFDQVYQLVSHAVAAQVLNRPLVVYGLEANELWARSIACALAAQRLAEATGDDPALAYTLGLLQGVGMIAVDAWALRTGREFALAMTEFPAEASASERVALGFTQADVGAVLLCDWEFPPEIIEPVRSQYRVPIPAGSAYTRLTALLLAAKWIRTAVLKRTGALEMPPISGRHLLPLQLSPQEISELVPVVENEFALVSSVLDELNEIAIDRQFFPGQRWRR